MIQITKTDAEWQSMLSDKDTEPLAFAVTRHAATERAYTGRYDDHWSPGKYVCVCCEADLFSSDSKYDAGCGWPSFTQTSHDQAIHTQLDIQRGIIGVEVLCAQCGAHLGHVFEDGPHPTGLRYCINSAALQFDSE